VAAASSRRQRLGGTIRRVQDGLVLLGRGDPLLWGLLAQFLLRCARPRQQCEGIPDVCPIGASFGPLRKQRRDNMAHVLLGNVELPAGKPSGTTTGNSEQRVRLDLLVDGLSSDAKQHGHVGGVEAVLPEQVTPDDRSRDRVGRFTAQA